MSQITTLTNHRSPQNQPHYFIRTHHLNRRPLCWSHQNKGSINQGCHKRFYRHMFFWFLYFTFLKLPPPPRAAILVYYIYIYHIFSIFQPYLVIVACVWTLIPTRIKTTLWSMSLSLDPSPCLTLDIWAHELKRQSTRIRCKKLLQSWILHVPCATHFAKSIQIDNIIPYEGLYIPLQPSHSLTHLVPCNLEALFQVHWVSCFNRCSVTLPSTLAQDGTFTCPLPYLAVLMSGEEMGRDCCGETKRGSLVAILILQLPRFFGLVIFVDWKNHIA